MSWKSTRFGDFVESSPNIKLKKGEHFSFIPMEDIDPQQKFANSSYEREYTGGGAKFANGDTIFARITPCLEHGKIAKVVNLKTEIGFGSTEFIVFRAKEGISDPDFIYYLAKSNNIKGPAIKSMVGSSGRQRARMDVIEEISIKAPDINTQHRIASILSAYDSLIENNRRRIQLLEQSARLLYREWFVYLRFPGHEHVRIIDGVPEGWKKTNAFDMMDVLSGGTPKTSVPDFWDGSIPFFTPKDATDSPYVYDTEKYITEQGLSKCSSQLYSKDTIFITARGTVGNLNLAQTSMAMNQSCYALIGKEPLTQYFLFCALHATIDQFTSRAVGAVFDAIIRDTFKLIPFVMPSKNLIVDFTEIVSPYFKQIDNLLMQNRKLRTGSDILLPRLMNGVIPV